MSMSVDSAGRARRVRRTRKPAARADDVARAEDAQLPALVGPPRAIPSGSPRLAGQAAVHAQVLGERRGLRAGATIHDTAKEAYNKVEWSGAKDRRAPKGKAAKTEI